MQSAIYRIYVIFISIIFSAVFLSLPGVVEAGKIPAFHGRVLNALTNAPVSGVWVKWQTAGCAKCPACESASAVRYEKANLTGDFIFDPMYPWPDEVTSGCTDPRAGKLIDTNLDGVNDAFQLEKTSPGCNDNGRELCIYDFGCYGSPANFSVVTPIGWSGYFDSISDYYFNNSQSERASDLGVLYYHPAVAPTPTPIGSTTSVIDFGIVPVSGISGTVFIDDGSGGGVKMDGVQNGGEIGYAGVRINASGTTLNQITTNAAGWYSFPAIPNGNYGLEMVLPANYTFTSPIFQNVTIPPGTVVNFGIIPSFTIKGNVFNDANKNLHMDASEGRVTGAVVGSTGGTVTLNNGIYGIENLIEGTYTISYTSPPPAGFYMLYPKPPSFVNVKVGPGCNVDMTTGASCSGGNIINLNFAVTDSMPWIQTYGLDLRVDDGFYNFQPASSVCGGGSYASGTDSSFTSPGIVFSGDGSSDFGQGFSSSRNWVVGGMSYPEVFQGATPLKTSAQNLLAAAAKAGITVNDLGDCSGGCNLNPLQKGFYHTSGNMKIDQNTNFNNGNYVFVSDGTITITNGSKINVLPSATVIFSAQNIIIDKTIGAAANVCPVPAGQIQGIFSADEDITVEGNHGNCVAGKDNMLNMEGTFIANATRQGGKFNNYRDLCEDNAAIPSLTIKARPDFILNAPGFLSQQNNISHEETP